MTARRLKSARSTPFNAGINSGRQVITKRCAHLGAPSNIHTARTMTTRRPSSALSTKRLGWGTLSANGVATKAAPSSLRRQGRWQEEGRVLLPARQGWNGERQAREECAHQGGVVGRERASFRSRHAEAGTKKRPGSGMDSPRGAESQPCDSVVGVDEMQALPPASRRTGRKDLAWRRRSRLPPAVAVVPGARNEPRWFSSRRRSTRIVVLPAKDEAHLRSRAFREAWEA